MNDAPQTPTLIAEQTAVNALTQRFDAAPLLAVDTEFVRETTYYPRLCLLQVGDQNQLACVDPLAPIDLAPMWDVLLAPRRTVLLHSARQDLELIYLATGRLPESLFDTQVAAALLGMPPQIGYAALVENLLGVQLDKSHTRTDWAQRPLSAAQLAYAAADVYYLPAVYEQLHARLAERGRLPWVQEDCADLLRAQLYETAPESAWERVKGLARLVEPERQAAAAALAAWRERLAARSNRPRQWILRDEALLAVAQTLPRDVQALRGIADLPPGVVQRRGEEILEILQGELVPIRAAAYAPLDADEKKRLEELSRVTRQHAQALDLEPQVLATRAELTALARGSSGGRVMRGWREEVLGRHLRAV